MEEWERKGEGGGRVIVKEGGIGERERERRKVGLKGGREG